MKTIYVKPQLTVVGINKPCLLTGSENIQLGNSYRSGETVLGKGGTFWSDDEPMDYDEDEIQ